MCGGSTGPFGAPSGTFADAASTINEAQHPRVLAGDHTLCAIVNDLRVCEPLARRSPCHTPAVTWGNVLPRFTGGEVVARSNPVSPTDITAGQRGVFGGGGHPLARIHC